MTEKEKLEAEKVALKTRLENIEDKIKYAELPEQLSRMFDVGGGWPRISQSLGLKDKLDKETYEALYTEMTNLVFEISKMVPPYEQTSHRCFYCSEVRSLLANQDKYR